MENLTKEQVQAWLLANPVEAADVVADVKTLKKAAAEAKSKAYNEATDSIKKAVMGSLAGEAGELWIEPLGEHISTLVSQGYVGIRVELPITHYVDEAGNGLASSVVGLVVGKAGRMRARKAGNPSGSRAARRTHIVTTPDGTTFRAGEWAAYIEAFGTAEERAKYAAKPEYAGKLADKIAKRLKHKNKYIENI